MKFEVLWLVGCLNEKNDNVHTPMCQILNPEEHPRGNCRIVVQNAHDFHLSRILAVNVKSGLDSNCETMGYS